MLKSQEPGCRFDPRCFLRLGAILVLLLTTSAMAGKEQFRSGILASLSLITRYHMTIIWAIEELEKKQKSRDSTHFYSGGHYYQMLVRKPAEKNKPLPRRPLTLPQLPAASPGLPPFHQSGTSARTPDELADEMAGLHVIPGANFPFPFLPPGSMPQTSPEKFARNTEKSSANRMKISPQALDREDLEKREKEQRRRESLHSRQHAAGRLDVELSFFIALESDAMSTYGVDQRSGTPDVSSEYSDSPLFSPYGSPHHSSPHQPHYLTSGRKRSAKSRHDGYFVGDSCRAIERKNLSHNAYFGGEYYDQEFFFERHLARAREDREWDFLEIKFRVYEQPPEYQFGLKEEMLCNVYHVRGRYYELCAPYAMPFDASLPELSNSRYVPIDPDIPASFVRKQREGDRDVVNVLKGFEKTIHDQLQNHFVSKGQKFVVDDGTVSKKTVTCIGRGQCAVVWQPGPYKLAFRRYAGHTRQSVLQQAWTQQASYAIYEQLSVAHDPEKHTLKNEEDIGLAPPMSLASTRVYSRFIPLPAPDSSWSLYEVQPLIPRDELVEHYMHLLFHHGPDHRVPVPLYRPALNTNVREGAEAEAGLGDIMQLIVEEILTQLEVVTDNLARYLESREPGSVNIGIDPKVANYQVRFCDASPCPGQQELLAFLANYDGYPPNLLLFSSKDDPEKSVLFKGGELYRLLNEYFGMYGFTEAFVGRTMKLNTLDKQILKMLASIAGEIDNQFESGQREFQKRRVLPFFLDVVNHWMMRRAASNNLSPPEPFNIDKVFAYQRDSALYHRAFRLHLLAAEAGSRVNPEKYSLPSAEFPVSEEQSEWLEQQKQEYLLHMIAFFSVDDIEGLQHFLVNLLDKKHPLPLHTIEFLEGFEHILREYKGLFQHLLQTGNYETLSEIIRDAFEARGLPEETGVAQLSVTNTCPLSKAEECRFSGSYVYSRREHTIHHLLLRRMFFIRSSMPFNGPPEIRTFDGPGTASRDYQHWLNLLKHRNIQLESRSVYSTRPGLLSGLLQIPKARLLAAFRNTHNRLRRRQDFKIPQQEELLNQLQNIMQQAIPDERGDFLSSSAGAARHRHTLLLASLLLDHPFVWIVPPSETDESFHISRYQLVFENGSQEYEERLSLAVNQTPLTFAELEQLVLQEQTSGVYHYYVLANVAENEWSILVPGGTDGPAPLEENPEDNPDLILRDVFKPAKKQEKKKGFLKTSTGEGSTTANCCERFCTILIFSLPTHLMIIFACYMA